MAILISDFLTKNSSSYIDTYVLMYLSMFIDTFALKCIVRRALFRISILRGLTLSVLFSNPLNSGGGKAQLAPLLNNKLLKIGGFPKIRMIWKIWVPNEMVVSHGNEKCTLICTNIFFPSSRGNLLFTIWVRPPCSWFKLNLDFLSISIKSYKSEVCILHSLI